MLNSRSRIMAYAPLPKLVPIGSPKITPADVAKNMITEVLKSEPVKRLLSQPNIVLKAISLAPSNQTPIYPSTSKNNIIGNVIQIKKKTDTSVTLSNLYLDDEANFLPSKKDAKSEIALLPIKRTQKKCGHYGPCENIICDVNFQQYVDYDGSSPILAINIEESEINAPVSKHCSNSLCDALSIDHNRCRRAVICLWHYDKSKSCDVCGILLKTRKSRFNHKNCKRKNIYQHNNIDNGQILRERMRMKELQMMAALKMKKHNYSDPLTADDKAIEILKNNSELIVIPKTTKKITTVQPPSTLAIKTILNHNNESINSFFGDSVLPNRKISILSQSENSAVSSQINNKQKDIKKNRNQKLNNNKLSEHQNHAEKLSEQQLNEKSPSKLMELDTTDENVKSINSQCIITGVSQGAVSYPLSKNDWIMANTTVTSTIPSAQKPYLMPVRVVPIANLKSQSSLLHQTEGIQRFCIIANNSVTGQSLVNLPTISTVPIANIQTPTPVVPASISVSPSIASDSMTGAAQSVKMSAPKSTKTNLNFKGEKKIIESSPSNESNLKCSRRYYGNRNKKRVEKKLFICTYCSKRFLTEWYFKMHIARHVGEVKATCQLCDKTFTHHYDLKRHVNTEHNHIETSTKKDNVNDIDKEEMEQHSPIIYNKSEYFLSSNTETTKHECKQIVRNVTNKSSIDIIESVENECCNGEIEKENGIGQQKIEDTLPLLKLRKIVRSHKKIIKKNVHRHRNKNKHFNNNSDKVSNDNTILKS
ncbi:hypothetical protein PV327_006216 [Microctonus hyperodae]|uniref:C2H2-type domain-containing protein n=1 Tax=Microctonus hyperodae TaxID=165561 RepID=A0AA39F3V7_MICHY|nr:hypothetical protein PV327_006216 [Microctonus hyperodae]